MNRLTALCFALMLSIAATSQPSQKITIYFPFNKYYITNDAAQILEKAIKANAGRTISSVKIYAYCDSIGTFSINDTLAMQRAAAVKAFLLNRGIGRNNFREIKGYGRRIPANDNSSDSLRALNRRAEIIIATRDISIKDSIRSIIQNIKAGEKFGLRNLNFNGGSHRILPKSLPILDSLCSILKIFSAVEVEIQGYVCCVPVGQEGYDMEERRWALSVNRAKAVYNYLMSKGIAAGRLNYKGFGNLPLAAETNEDGKAANRRVEIKILKK